MKLLILLFIFLTSTSFAQDCTEVIFRKSELEKCDGECVFKEVQASGKELLTQLFNERLQYKSLLPSPEGKICALQIKELMVLLREKADLVGANLYNQIKISDVDFKKVAPPIMDHSQYPEYFLSSPSEKFEFLPGDVMITKGVSLVSSSISALSSYHSGFSHIVFLQIDPSSKEISTIESYIGKGVGVYPIVEALKNENARILVLRSKDQDLAEKASLYMGERVKKVAEAGAYIPYDFDFNFEDDSKLSCEEVAYSALKFASNGQMIIPEYPTELNIANPDITRRFNIKTGTLMMPADMESDSRFEVVLDWTDFRLIRDSWRKDVIAQVMIEELNKGNYRIPETFASRIARIIWKGRKIKWLWPLLSKISGIDRNITPDVPVNNIATIASFKKVEQLFLPVLQKADLEFYQKNRYWAERMYLFKKMQELMPIKRDEALKVLEGSL
ncbi:MAG: hypothetical protein AB7I27_11675 [Bacteriovoracaceae bacterium]